MFAQFAMVLPRSAARPRGRFARSHYLWRALRSPMIMDEPRVWPSSQRRRASSSDGDVVGDMYMPTTVTPFGADATRAWAARVR